MTYTLTRSKRKTVALHICDGKIEVRAPLRMPKYAIDEFVASKERWIKKHLTRSQQQVRNRDNFCLNYGDRIQILDESFVITENNEWLCSSPLGQNNEIYMKSGMTPEQIKVACIDLCKLIATGHLIFRTEELAKKMSVSPNSIKISNAKSRWGSCSANKDISYSWRLIMADEDAVDYVIVHELAHLLEMNHSQRFWTIVESVTPDYKDCKKRLKELQIKLANENW